MTDDLLFIVPPARAAGSRAVVCPVIRPDSTSPPMSARLDSAVAGTEAMPGCAHVCTVVCSGNVSHAGGNSNTKLSHADKTTLPGGPKKVIPQF